eukprot:COSAG05_NODE_23260_length_259_cov_0.650000_1_plen_67_part_01
MILQYLRNHESALTVAPTAQNEAVDEVVKFLRLLGHFVHVQQRKRDFSSSEVFEHLEMETRPLALYR